MLGRTYDAQTCSVAGTLELVGERWTLLVVRDAFMGARRFEDFQRRTGAARNVLAARLNLLVEEGIFRKVAYQVHPARYEYRLTEKGVDLWPVIVSLLQWGDRHIYPGRAPVLLVHKKCGGAVSDRRTCETCGALLGPRDVEARRGTGGGMVAAGELSA
jgi:DNA-binding HxlR family transcriptional regulator